MTAQTPRDTIGRFATHEHSTPEVGLAPAQNPDGHYEWEEPLFELDAADAGELQRIDDYFAAGEPAMTEGTVNLFDRTTWGDTPF